MSVLAENNWSPDARKLLQFICYDQLQREYEDEDFEPRTEFFPSLAIKCAAEAWSHPNLLPLPVWILIFLCFSLSLFNQSMHIHMHTLLPQHLYLCNPVTNPRVNNETLTCELLRAGLWFLYCASAFATNQLLTQVSPLKASSSYSCGKTTVTPIQLWHTYPAWSTSAAFCPNVSKCRVGQTVTCYLPSVLEQFYLKTLSNWDAATSKRRDLRGHYQVSYNACFN